MPVAVVAKPAKATEAPPWPPESPDLSWRPPLCPRPAPASTQWPSGREGGDLSHVCSCLVLVFPHLV